jgi:hypothetical protein
MMSEYYAVMKYAKDLPKEYLEGLTVYRLLMQQNNDVSTQWFWDSSVERTSKDELPSDAQSTEIMFPVAINGVLLWNRSNGYVNAETNTAYLPYDLIFMLYNLPSSL